MVKSVRETVADVTWVKFPGTAEWFLAKTVDFCEALSGVLHLVEISKDRTRIGKFILVENSSY